MSMALFVILADDRSPTAVAWQKGLNEHDVPIQFVKGTNLRRQGVIPLRLRGRKSSFQFFIESFAEMSAEYPQLANITLPSPVIYSMVYQGDLLEAASAFYAASVLVARFGGVAFDPSGSDFITEGELLDAAREFEVLARHK